MATRADKQAKTPTQWTVALNSLLVIAGAITVWTNSYGRINTCRCRSIPGDDGWPSESDWSGLNQTVNGNLIATVPIAAVCHRIVADKSAD